MKRIKYRQNYIQCCRGSCKEHDERLCSERIPQEENTWEDLQEGYYSVITGQLDQICKGEG